MSTQDEYDQQWAASDEDQAALAEQLAATLAAREEVQAQTQQLALEQQQLVETRGAVQGQVAGLEGDIGSFRREQQLAYEAGHTARVDLAAAQGGGDFYSPDVGQKIAPDGTVTYDFDAHLHARGLDLDAGGSIDAPNDRRVRWLRTTDGALIAEIYSYEEGIASAVNIIAHTTGSKIAQTFLESRNDLNQADDAYLGTETGAGSNPPYARAYAKAGPYLKNLIYADGRSDFLQLSALAKRKIDWGYYPTRFQANATISDITTVTHGMGVAPAIVLLTAAGGSGVAPLWWNSTATTVQFRAERWAPISAVAAVDVYCAWLAIG